MCREIAAKLDTPIPLAMRHPTLREVLAAYADKTGLRFILPERPYADTKIPAFDTFGTGWTGWPISAAPFRFPDYVWQTQGDGKIFVGSWRGLALAGTPGRNPAGGVFPGAGHRGARS